MPVPRSSSQCLNHFPLIPTHYKNLMYYFIRDKWSGNLWHTVLGLVKIKGESFHPKETDVSGHQETKKQPKEEFTVPLFPVKYNAEKGSYFTHTLPVLCQRRDFIQCPSCSGVCTGGAGLEGGARRRVLFCSHATAVPGASVQAIKWLSLRQKPRETSRLTLLIWHNEGQISLHYLLGNELASTMSK